MDRYWISKILNCWSVDFLSIQSICLISHFITFHDHLWSEDEQNSRNKDRKFKIDLCLFIQMIQIISLYLWAQWNETEEIMMAQGYCPVVLPKYDIEWQEGVELCFTIFWISARYRFGEFCLSVLESFQASLDERKERGNSPGNQTMAHHPTVRLKTERPRAHLHLVGGGLLFSSWSWQSFKLMKCYFCRESERYARFPRLVDGLSPLRDTREMNFWFMPAELR